MTTMTQQQIVTQLEDELETARGAYAELESSINKIERLLRQSPKRAFQFEAKRINAYSPGTRDQGMGMDMPAWLDEIDEVLNGADDATDDR